MLYKSELFGRDCSRGLAPKLHLVGTGLFSSGPGALYPQGHPEIVTCSPPLAHSTQGQRVYQAGQSCTPMSDPFTGHMEVSSSQSSEGDSLNRGQGGQSRLLLLVLPHLAMGSSKRPLPLWLQSFHPSTVILTLYWPELHRGKNTV